MPRHHSRPDGCKPQDDDQAVLLRSSCGSARWRTGDRTRKQFIEAGRLEETERIGHIEYCRLDPRRMGENVVVTSMRCAARDGSHWSRCPVKASADEELEGPAKSAGESLESLTGRA